MNQIELKVYYPAGGKSSQDIVITSVEVTSKDNVFIGKAVLPHLSDEQKVIIYILELSDGRIDYRTIPARCPHQGADITNDALKSDGMFIVLCIAVQFVCIVNIIKHTL